jgi:hypothetical protein
MQMPPENQQVSADCCPASDIWFSQSELQQLVVKAARGAGYCWSDAEEIGWAAAWLSKFGLHGGDLMLGLMQSNDLQAPRPAAQRWKGNCHPLCPLRCGLALMDFAQLPEGLGTSSLVIESMTGLPCFLAFVGRTARQVHHPLQIQWEEQSLFVNEDGQPSVEVDQVSMEFWKTVDVRITRSNSDMVSIETKNPQYCVGVSKQILEQLEAFAHQTLVPSSDLSRLRAGGHDDPIS